MIPRRESGPQNGRAAAYSRDFVVPPVAAIGVSGGSHRRSRGVSASVPINCSILHDDRKKAVDDAPTHRKKKPK